MNNVQERMDIFFDKNAPSIVVEISEYRDGYNNIRKRGGKIRAFTEITKENISYCKELIKLVDELRHLDGVRGGVAVSESEYMATTVLKEATPLTQVIYSNVKEVIEQGQYIFDTLWRTAIPADKKIKEIEEGIIPEVIEFIDDPIQLQKKIFDLLQKAKDEILIIFSTANAFHRQENIGSIKLLNELRDTYPELKIKILTPKDERIEETSKTMSNNKNLFFRFIEPISKVSILVVDRKYSLTAELKDDDKQTMAGAVGLATYSNSLPTVHSYASTLDIIWNQTELYEQLEIHDKMQKEFINIAAHELRTPIQPIINVVDFIKAKLSDKDLIDLVDILHKNAKRLKRLSDDILDLTKIESNSLIFHKENFSIRDLINEIIKGYQSNFSNKTINITYDVPDDLIVYADKNRIGQVISNLISNSIKFSSSTSVFIHLKCERHYLNKNGNNKKPVITVSIKDKGKGIDATLMQKLFTKFTTTSSQGIGLGLYISKKIIETQGGKIWAINNKDKIGATFSFTIPSK